MTDQEISSRQSPTTTVTQLRLTRRFPIQSLAAIQWLTFGRAFLAELASSFIHSLKGAAGTCGKSGRPFWARRPWWTFGAYGGAKVEVRHRGRICAALDGRGRASMAVDLIQLAAALRLGDGVTAPTEPVAGLLIKAVASVPGIRCESCTGCSGGHSRRSRHPIDGDLYDSPTAASGDRYAAAWRNSGAEALVSRFVVRRAGSEGVPDAGTSTGGLDDAQVRAIVETLLGEHADLETVHHTPPTDAGGGQDVVTHNAAADSHEDIREAVERQGNPGHRRGNGPTPD